MRKLWKRVGESIKRICLVDRFLMIFMLALFFYTIIRLFGGTSVSADTGTIDVIVRTSIAAVFGYFISSNFTKPDVSAPAQNTDTPPMRLSSKSTDAGSDNGVKNQIGFQTSAATPDEELGKITFSENTPLPPRSRRQMQIFVVSVIGLISLTILFLTGYIENVTTEIAAIISQLRDFVSACIGFLISCGKNTAD